MLWYDMICSAIIWHMTYDTWYTICDFWYMIHDIWYDLCYVMIWYDINDTITWYMIWSLIHDMIYDTWYMLHDLADGWYIIWYIYIWSNPYVHIDMNMVYLWEFSIPYALQFHRPKRQGTTGRKLSCCSHWRVNRQSFSRIPPFKKSNGQQKITGRYTYPLVI